MASDSVTLLGTPIVTEDKTAATAITPGWLVDISTTTVVKHATAASTALPRFALERDELGSEMSVDYATGDYVKVGVFSSGMRVNALIGSGVTTAVGSFMCSNGDGTLAVLGTSSNTTNAERQSVVGQALEVKSAAGRLRVEIF